MNLALEQHAANMRKNGPTFVMRRKTGAVREIIKRHASEAMLTLDEVLSASRESGLVRCRVAISHELRQMGMSLHQIGRHLNRNHSTILHYLESRPMRKEAKPIDPVQVPDLSGEWAI